MEIIAHRGASHQAPENTEAAIEKAISLDVDGIEIDLNLTKDNQIILLHDNTINRTTNGSGHVRDFSYQAIKNFDAGSWFDSSFTGLPIPLLSHVFQNFKTKFLIEIKIREPQQSYEHVFKLLKKWKEDPERVVRKIENKFPLTYHTTIETCKLIKQYGIEASIQSFSIRPLFLCEYFHPDISLEYLSYGIMGNLKPATLEVLKTLNIKSVNLNYALYNESNSKLLNRTGKQLGCWTVNEVEKLSHLRNLGVSKIITDDPRQLKTKD